MSVPRKKKSVRFNDKIDIRILCVWDFASRQARIGLWERDARDRSRFGKRIREVGEVVDCVLLKKYIEYVKNSVLIKKCN